MVEDIFADLREQPAPAPLEEEEEDIFADLREPVPAPRQQGGDGRVNPESVYGYLLDSGVSPIHAVGMLNNIRHESGFEADINERAPLVQGSRGGYGLFQHTGSRRKQLEDYARRTGRPVSDWQTQVDFALQEGDTRKYLAKNLHSPEQASAVFTTEWERPANKEQKAHQRLSTLGEYSALLGLPYEPGALIPDFGGQRQEPSGEEMEAAFGRLFADFEPAQVAQAAPEQVGDFAGGMEQSWRSLKQMGSGAVAVAGDVFGIDDWKEWGVKSFQDLEQEGDAASEGLVTQIEDIEGIGSAVDWLQYQLGQAAGSVLETVGSAAIGGLVGAGAGAGLGALPVAAAGAVGKKAVKGMLRSKVAEMTKQNVAKGMAATAAKKAAVRQMSAKVGAITAVMASSYGQGVGDIYGEFINEDGTVDENAVASALVGAVPYMALDNILELSLVKNVAKGTNGEKLLKRLAKGIAKGFAIEGSTEAGQEAVKMGVAGETINEYIAGLGDGESYSGEEITSALMNSFLAGGVAGGAMAAPTAGMRTPEQRAADEEAEAGLAVNERWSQELSTEPETAEDEAAAIRAVQDGRKQAGMVLRPESIQAAEAAGLTIIEAENGVLVTRPENAEAAAEAEKAGEQYRILGYVEDKADALKDPDAVMVRPVDASGASPGAQVVSRQNLEAAQAAAKVQAGEGGTVETIPIAEEYQRRIEAQEAEQVEAQNAAAAAAEAAEQEARTAEVEKARRAAEQSPAGARQRQIEEEFQGGEPYQEGVEVDMTTPEGREAAIRAIEAGKFVEPPPRMPEREIPATSRARELASENGIDIADISAGGTQVTVPDVRKHIQAQRKAKVTPISEARRKAEAEEIAESKAAVVASKKVQEVTPEPSTVAEAEALARRFSPKTQVAFETEEAAAIAEKRKIPEDVVQREAEDEVRKTPAKHRTFEGQEDLDWALGYIDKRREWDAVTNKKARRKLREFTAGPYVQALQNTSSSILGLRDGVKRSLIGKRPEVKSLAEAGTQLAGRAAKLDPHVRPNGSTKHGPDMLLRLEGDIRAWKKKIDALEIKRVAAEVDVSLKPVSKKGEKTAAQKRGEAAAWMALFTDRERLGITPKQIMNARQRGLTPEEMLLEAKGSFVVGTGSHEAQEGAAALVETEGMEFEGESQAAKTAGKEEEKGAGAATRRGKSAAATPEAQAIIRAEREEAEREEAEKAVEGMSKEQIKASHKAVADAAAAVDARKKKIKEEQARAKRGISAAATPESQAKIRAEREAAKKASEEMGKEQAKASLEAAAKAAGAVSARRVEIKKRRRKIPPRADKIRRDQAQYVMDQLVLAGNPQREGILEAREDAIGRAEMLADDPMTDFPTVVEEMLDALHPNDPYRYVLDAIHAKGLGDVEFAILPDAEVRQRMDDSDAVAGFISGTYPDGTPARTIVLADSIATSPRGLKSLVHEMVHASMNEALRTDNQVAMEMEALRREAERRLGTYDPVKRPHLYGLTDVHEFLAEALSNEHFQRVLAGIRTSDGRSLWQKLIDSIRDFLGIPVEADTILAQVLSAAPDLMMSEAQANRRMADRNAAPYITSPIDAGEVVASIMWSDRKHADRANDIARKHIDKGFRVGKGYSRELVKNRGWLGGMTTDQIIRTYGGEFASGALAKYNRWNQRRTAIARHGQMEAEKIDACWRDAEAKDGERIGAAMLDSTLAGIDPSIAKVKGDDQATYDKLRTQFNQLSRQGKQVYRDVRDYYSKQREAKKLAMIGKLVDFKVVNPATRANLQAALNGATTAAQVNQAFKAVYAAEPDLEGKLDDVHRAAKRVTELASVKGPYFPLSRFGDYVVSGHKGEGDSAQEYTAFHESLEEAEADYARLKGQGYAMDAGEPTLKQNWRHVGLEHAPSLIAQLTNRVDADVAQQINVALIEMLSENSMRKSELQRKGTPGVKAGEMKRAFAQRAFSGSWELGDLQTAFERSDAIKEMRKEAKTGDAATVSKGRVLDEIVERESRMLSERNISKLDQFLSKFGFIMYLASPSYAMVNATQPWAVGLPYLASKYGLAASTATMGRHMGTLMGPAIKQIRKGYSAGQRSKSLEGTWEEMQKKFGPNAQKMIQELQDRGIIDATFAQELYRTAASKDSTLNKATDAVMEFSRKLPQVVEVQNRILMAVAAYDLHKGTHEEKTQAAADAVYQTQFDYSDANKPRWFKHNIPGSRALFMFKMYAQGIYALTLPAFLKAMKGDKEAMKLFGGIMATHTLTAGVLGGIFTEPLRALAGIASLFFGTPDEEEVELAIENFFNDLAGDKLGEMMTRGLPRGLGLDVHGRAGMQGLMFMDLNSDAKNSEEWYNKSVLSLLGPVHAATANTFKAWDYYKQGDITKAISTSAPKFIKDMTKAYDQQTRGLTSRKGEVFVDPEEFNWAEGFMQGVVGFTPAEAARGWERRIARTAADTKMLSEADALRQRFVNASPAERARLLRGEIREFNRENPAFFLKPDNLWKSVRTRAKKEREQVGGYYIDPSKRVWLNQEVRF